MFKKRITSDYTKEVYQCLAAVTPRRPLVVISAVSAIPSPARPPADPAPARKIGALLIGERLYLSSIVLLKFFDKLKYINMLKKEILKHILIWLGAVLGLIAVFSLMYFFLWQNNSSEKIFEINLDEVDQRRGNVEAKIVLVEYSDFQCPACAAYASVVEQLLKDYPSEILFVYRHFPLKTIHKNAELAALASEASGKQGKFWEMYEKLFKTQSLWSEQSNAKEIFLNYAKELGLEEEKFAFDLESREVEGKVALDVQSGFRFQVNATPTFFLNGKKLQNPAGYEAFKRIIEAELDQ